VNFEAASLAWGAVDADRSAKGVDQPTRDVKPEPNSFRKFFRSCALERVENEWLLLWRDAHTRIAHFQQQLCQPRANPHAHFACGGKLESVVHQVAHDHFELGAVDAGRR